MRTREHMKPAEAEAAGLFCRSALRKQFRLKPATGQRSAGMVWQGHGWYPVFAKIDCVPLRARRKPSAAQLAALAAGRECIGTAVCSECGKRFDRENLRRGVCYDCESAQIFRRVCATAAAWSAVNPLFLDTETTGLTETDQVIELAILDLTGGVLFHSRLRPAVPIHPDAAAVHGIAETDLAGAPAYQDVHAQVAEVLSGRVVIAHGANFDHRLLRQTARAFDLPAIESDWCCTMELLTDLNDGRWPQLAIAAELAGVLIDEGRQHSARYDADIVRQIVRSLANNAIT